MGGRACWAEELSGQKFNGGLDSRTQEPYPGLGRPFPLLAGLTQTPVYPLPPGTFGYSLYPGLNALSWAYTSSRAVCNARSGLVVWGVPHPLRPDGLAELEGLRTICPNAFYR